VRFLATLAVIAVCAAVLARTSEAHLVRHPDKPGLSVLENREASQVANLAHARYVCRRGGGEHKRWACAARSWLLEELSETRRALRPPVSATIARMIGAGEQVAAESKGDPWPNCDDPHDGSGASWQDTKNCESPDHGWSEDPPGYYCGPLQIDPAIWAHVIRRWGVPC
jgi:hypothetical protein